MQEKGKEKVRLGSPWNRTATLPELGRKTSSLRGPTSARLYQRTLARQATPFNAATQRLGVYE